MQRMGERVGARITPLHHLAIHPDHTISVIKRNQGHVSISPAKGLPVTNKSLLTAKRL